MRIGYARVSTAEQDVAAQVHALKAACCDSIVEETASGGDNTRPKLGQIMREIGAGDVLIVTRLDRVARSLKHLLEIISGLNERGASFKTLIGPIDTSSSAGMFTTQILGACAEFERALIRERTMEGLKAAARRGKKFGRAAKHYPIQKHRDDLKRAQARKDVELLKVYGPVMQAFRPGLSWDNTVEAARALLGEAHNPAVTAMVLKRLGRVWARRTKDTRILVDCRKKGPADRRLYLMRGFDKLAPGREVKGVIDLLASFGEPSPTGGRRWSELQVLSEFSRMRELFWREDQAA